MRLERKKEVYGGDRREDKTREKSVRRWSKEINIIRKRGIKALKMKGRMRLLGARKRIRRRSKGGSKKIT